MLGTVKPEYSDILFRWVRYSSKFKLSETLLNNNIRRIAIYGGGALGVALYENLVEFIDIKYVIDKNPSASFPYDVQTILPSETERLLELDAVIITTVESNSVEESLRPYALCLSLNDLIIDVDEYLLLERAVRHVAECRATLLLADLTAPLFHIENPSFYEKIAKDGAVSLGKLYGRDVLCDFYNDLDGCSIEYCKEVFTTELPVAIIKKGSVTYLNDIRQKYFNVINSCRFTTDGPDEYDNTIHFFGNCVAVGYFTEDQYTIESHLQRMLNQAPLSKKSFRVVNRSNRLECMESLRQVINTPFQAGDYIILICSDAYKYRLYYAENEWIQYVRLASAFDRPHEYGEVFFDHYHMNHRGYKLLADKLYDILNDLADKSFLVEQINSMKENSVKTKTDNQDKFLEPVDHALRTDFSELTDYLDFLRAEKEEVNGTVGSIVMNCNPFTFGHRFLIEEALKQCDFLYIFVVEEDKSFFPFAERMACVKAGVSNIQNIKVIPSGKFIISTLTFPEYFDKEQAVAIDASLDIELFAAQIAPVLNIKKRFVGEEPICPVTRQYNNAMREVLPAYGIELVIFKRKEIDAVPISASKVRELLKHENFEELKAFVPMSTFEYLIRFKDRDR